MATKKLFLQKQSALGTYWVPLVPAAELRALLRGMAGGALKAASIGGGDQEQGFEQAFASLAYSYLKEKAPRLLDFIVGFQLVDRNEDNTKAIGLFGFKVGDQWLYAPTFFLNGDLKGHELLYIKKQDSFVPMKENWVNYLISRKPRILGEGSPQPAHELGGLMPNLHRFRGPPSGGIKTGGHRPPLADWAKPFMPILAAVAVKADAVFAKHAGLAARLDLRNFLREFPRLKLAFDKFYCGYPLVKEGFDRFYGRDFFQRMALDIREDAARGDLVKRARSYVMPPRKKPRPKGRLSLIEEAPPEEHPIKSGALRIYVHDALAAAGRVVKLAAENRVNGDEAGTIVDNVDLSEGERERLLKDTVLIKDERDPHQVSVAYNTQTRLELVNPHETGLYQILEKPGSFDEMVVITSPQSGDGRKKFALVVRKSSPRNWLNTHATNLWAKQTGAPERQAWKDYFGGLDGVDSLAKGGTYVAVGENGDGTCPFKVRESYGDGAYEVSWLDYPQWGHDRPRYLPRVYEQSHYDCDVGYSPYRAKIWINQKKGCGLRSVSGGLAVPSTFKVIKISDPPAPRREHDPDCLVSCCHPAGDESAGDGSSGSDEEPIQPGNLVDVQTMIHQKEARLSAHYTGANTFYLKSSRLGNHSLTKKACLIHLVRDHGLSELQARAIMNEAEHSALRQRASHYYVKYAAPFGELQPGPGAPAIPEPWYGTEMNGPNAVQAIYPQEETVPVDGMSSYMTDPSIYDPFYQPDPDAMRVAQQAAQTGQKEVFDTAMISGMLKSVRQDSLVDRHLGDLMSALDKIGRILFMFYWHQEEFEDRYGKQDLPELEDSLRNTFESLGDLCLYLMEKTVAGDAGMQMAGVGSADSEPSIEDSARV